MFLSAIIKPMIKFEFNDIVFLDLLASLSYLIDLEEKEKIYHCWKVAIIANKFSEVVPKKESNLMFYAGLIHDFGAVGATMHIIHFPTIELQLKEPRIREHPMQGAKLALAMPGISQTANYILEHHEFWNGSGYPDGKQKDNILLGSQILHISDWYDIVTRYSPEKPMSELIKKVNNSLFSPNICTAFFDFISKLDNRILNMSNSNIEQIFEEVKANIKPIILPSGTDAMGKILRVFSIVIDSKHQYTAGHSERVSEYSMKIALMLNLSHDEVTKTRFAGLLHDIGKVTVPKEILDKPDTLTNTEWETIKQHPVTTINVLKKIHGFEEIAYLGGHHHEKYDGTGYPDKLKGEEIPIISRIIAIADTFDALRSTRAYRKCLDYNTTLEILRKNAGTQFDPKIIDIISSEEFITFQNETIIKTGC